MHRPDAEAGDNPPFLKKTISRHANTVAHGIANFCFDSPCGSLLVSNVPSSTMAAARMLLLLTNIWGFYKQP